MEEDGRGGSVYDSTLSCPFANHRRHHPATGQSEILFSKPPRLNQCIALNGVLLVTPLPLPRAPTPAQAVHSRMNYSCPRLNSARGSRLSGSQSEITGPDYNSARPAVRRPSVKTLKTLSKPSPFPLLPAPLARAGTQGATGISI